MENERRYEEERALIEDELKGSLRSKSGSGGGSQEQADEQRVTSVGHSHTLSPEASRKSVRSQSVLLSSSPPGASLTAAAGRAAVNAWAADSVRHSHVPSPEASHRLSPCRSAPFPSSSLGMGLTAVTGRVADGAMAGRGVAPPSTPITRGIHVSRQRNSNASCT